MQAALPFHRITTDDWRTQQARHATEAAQAAAAAHPPQPKRSVGRPKRCLDATNVLAAVAAATDSEQPSSKKQRGKYTDWFTSPYIVDILREFQRCGYRPVITVKRLQMAASDGRYDRLSHSSLIGWYDHDSKKLLPRFQAHLDSGLENVRQNGQISAFDEMPGVEEEIKQTLLQMRAAGTAINSHVIRWVMQGIIKLRAPNSQLASLRLGQQYVCAWARRSLKWAWRKSTTAASKLPLDWEEQGLQMAMRIAATMEMKKVSQLPPASVCVQ